VVSVENLADWRGKDLVDRDGDKIGKLEDVYIDTQTEEPMFGSVKEGLISKHLTFVPLIGAAASPDGIRVTASKDQVSDAPNVDQGADLDEDGESQLYSYYQIAWSPAQTATGRRLARR
jgi:hypothetical protein